MPGDLAGYHSTGLAAAPELGGVGGRGSGWALRALLLSGGSEEGGRRGEVGAGHREGEAR